jgi:F-type H+-transporting ATPase subunit delta
MKFTVKQYAQSLYEVLTDSNPKDHDRVIENFISVLKANDDLSAYEKIVNEVDSLFQTDNETSKIEVTAANEKSITPSLLKELNKLAKTKAEITTKIDDKIIGGVIIRVDDQLIDASISTQLQNLEKDLTQ